MKNINLLVLVLLAISIKGSCTIPDQKNAVGYVELNNSMNVYAKNNNDISLLSENFNQSINGPLKEALQIKAGIPKTRQGFDEATFQNYINLVEKIEGVVYLDLQNKQTAKADEIQARARFDVPNSSNCIIKVEFGGLCGNFYVDRLFLSNKEGEVLDTIECCISAYPGIDSKQYTMENGMIQVYSLIPSAQNTLLFEYFGNSYSSFVGTRYDEEYIVDGDNFKLVKRTEYQEKTYYCSDLNQFGKEEIYHIWEGDETVESIQTVN